MYAEYIHFFIASMMSVFGIQVLNQVSGVIGSQYPEAFSVNHTLSITF